MNSTLRTTNFVKSAFGWWLLVAILINPLATKAQFSLSALHDSGLKAISGLSPSGLKSADMDNDGKMDLVMCFNDNNTVQIFLNSTSSKPSEETSFSSPFQFSYTEGTSGEFSIGDMNRDGFPEIVISNTANASIIVLQNTSSPGKISFASSQFFDSPGVTGALSICDLNADGFSDIISACGDKLLVYRNSCSDKASSINLESMIQLPAYGIIHDLKCADIDGDGNADIVASTHNAIAVVKNLTSYGSQTLIFADAVLQNTGRSVNNLDIGDIDNDFKPDVVTANWPNGDISILPNLSQNGNINFGQPVFMEAGSPQGIVLGDFDQDGKFDIAASSNGTGMKITKVFRNISIGEGDFNFAEPQHFVALSNELIVKDFDRNGSDDLVGLNPERNQIELLLHTDVPIINTLPELNIYCGEDGKIWMDWDVALQNKAASYDIEKTMDGVIFNSIVVLTEGETTGGIMNFSYSDTNAAGDIEYYRLKIAKTNGDLSYSELKCAQPCMDVITGFVCSYPNPVDRVMNFNFSISSELEMHYSIIDMNMKIQLEKTEIVTPGTRTYSLDITQFQKGSYIFAVKFGNLTPKVCRFEKL